MLTSKSCCPRSELSIHRMIVISLEPNVSMSIGELGKCGAWTVLCTIRSTVLIQKKNVISRRVEMNYMTVIVPAFLEIGSRILVTSTHGAIYVYTLGNEVSQLSLHCPPHISFLVGFRLLLHQVAD